MKRVTVLGLVMVSMCTWAAAPKLIPFQGRLTTSSGTAVDGATELRFRLYWTATPTGAGDVVFEETQTVQVSRGAFSTYLGQVNALDLSIFKSHGELYVGVKVGNDTQELAPLFRLATTPWAAHAETCGDATTIEGQSFASLSAPNWSAIQNKPAAVDALPTVSCANGQALVGADGGWNCAPIPDAYTKTEADDRFAQLKSCYWINTPGDGGSALNATCAAGDYVVSGGCDGNAGSGNVVESFPGPSAGGYKNRPSGPWQIGTLANDPNVPVIDRWLCRTSAGTVLDSAYALCCPGR